MKFKYTISAFVALAAIIPTDAHEPDFGRNFCDSTLRVDYIFGGNAKKSDVYLKGQSKRAGWAGRRHNLDRIPYTGNGIVTVVDSLSGDTIYRHSYSSLFLEWQSTDEAKRADRSFEHTVLLPLPRRAAVITAELLDTRHRPVARTTYTYSPGDILVEQRSPKNPAEWKYIHKGGDPEQTIDVVILAEGYSPEEKDKFYEDAAKSVEAILTLEPYNSMRDRFNFVAAATTDSDHGVTIPRLGEWKHTPFSSNFDTFYMDRYLTTDHIFDIHDAASHVPYEHVIILANCDTYGGGGVYNSYTLTTTGHKNFAQVVAHEFGHSFGGLADEYYYEGDAMQEMYPSDAEPWEPNITTLHDFKGKWENLLKPGTPVPTPADNAGKYPVGVYEGGGYTAKGVYRPAISCRMHDNDWPGFCPACAQALQRLIDFYTR